MPHDNEEDENFMETHESSSVGFLILLRFRLSCFVSRKKQHVPGQHVKDDAILSWYTSIV